MNGIAGSDYKCTFNFIKYGPVDVNCQSQQQCPRIPMGHSLTNTWYRSLFHFSHSRGCGAASHYSFNLKKKEKEKSTTYDLFLSSFFLLGV